MIHSQFPLSSVVGFGCPSPPPESNACLQKVIKEQDLFDPQLLPLGWVGGQQPAQAPPAQLPPRSQALSVRQTLLDQSARPGHKPVSAFVLLEMNMLIWLRTIDRFGYKFLTSGPKDGRPGKFCGRPA